MKKNVSKKVAHLFMSVAFATGIGATLSSCASPESYEPEEIANLNEHVDGQLVQGQEACVKAIMEHDSYNASAGWDDKDDDKTVKAKSLANAQKICKEMEDEARKKYIAEHGGDNSNLTNMILFYYLIGRNSTPSVYYGSSNGGMSHLYSRPISGDANLVNPPVKLTKNQSEYLSASTLEGRSTISRKLVEGGSKLAPVKSSKGEFIMRDGGFSKSGKTFEARSFSNKKGAMKIGTSSVRRSSSSHYSSSYRSSSSRSSGGMRSSSGRSSFSGGRSGGSSGG